MDNQQERSAFELGWLIGIIDGEGSFWMSKGISSNGQYQYYQPVFEIVNTNFEIISKLDVFFINIVFPTILVMVKETPLVNLSKELR